MPQFDERIVPEELIVGISGDKAFVTYNETKNGKTSLNSKASWTRWSDNANKPLVVLNNFSRGFRITGKVRYGNTQDYIAIEHPLFKKSLEFNTRELIELIKNCGVDNGVIMEEFILNKQRKLLTRSQYNAEIKAYQGKDAEELKIQNSLDARKISGKEQLPGMLFQDKHDDYYIYFGTMQVNGGKAEHCYSKVDAGMINIFDGIANKQLNQFAAFTSKKQAYKCNFDYNIYNYFTEKEITDWVTKINNPSTAYNYHSYSYYFDVNWKKVIKKPLECGKFLFPSQIEGTYKQYAPLIKTLPANKFKVRWARTDLYNKFLKTKKLTNLDFETIKKEYS
jgi:hypothetical protein